MARMLVTRPEPDAADTVGRLNALGIAGIALPLLERATLHTSLPDSRGFAAIALTSANALRALGERDVLGKWRETPAFTVGDRTADVARLAGFTDVTACGGTLARMVETLGHARLTGPVFYPTARHQSGDLAQALVPYGMMVVTAKVYEMRTVSSLSPDRLAEIAGNHYAAALFYSRRTAEAFVALTQGLDMPARTGLGVICLSEQVAEPLLAARFVRVGLADHPSEEAMMTIALSFARDQNAS
jgi:uroporphyrinogen-III synthase